MTEIIVTNEQLAELFANNEIIDKYNGWYYDGKLIEIIAIHKNEIKYIQDVTKAKTYRLKFR